MSLLGKIVRTGRVAQHIRQSSGSDHTPAAGSDNVLRPGRGAATIWQATMSAKVIVMSGR